jgi:sulfide:quinone oxidoreductase
MSIAAVMTASDQTAIVTIATGDLNMRERILVLRAGFGGLELSTLISESLRESVEVTLIDKSDHFMFGFSKLDVMFGHAEGHAIRMPYANFVKPGVRLDVVG